MPTLIYALQDADLDVMRAARDSLLRISRKFEVSGPVTSRATTNAARRSNGGRHGTWRFTPMPILRRDGQSVNTQTATRLDDRAGSREPGAGLRVSRYDQVAVGSSRC